MFSSIFILFYYTLLVCVCVCVTLPTVFSFHDFLLFLFLYIPFFLLCQVYNNKNFLKYFFFYCRFVKHISRFIKKYNVFDIPTSRINYNLHNYLNFIQSLLNFFNVPLFLLNSHNIISTICINNLPCYCI